MIRTDNYRKFPNAETLWQLIKVPRTKREFLSADTFLAVTHLLSFFD